MKVGIIGGGIVGLCSAYYLQKAGHQVTILDKGDFQQGCSFGNAGMIVPSHIVPLAAPGMIRKGIRWMFDSTSPFYVKPRLSLDLAKWGYHFYRNANKTHVKESIPVLRDLSLLSSEAYSELAKTLPFDFGYQERGLLMLFQNQDTEKEEIETAEIANENGVLAKVLSPGEIQELEPDVKVTVRGGVFYPCDTHMTPHLFVNGLVSYLKAAGVTFQSNCIVQDFVVTRNRITSLRTSVDELFFDEIVLCAGSWSGEMCKKLRINLPMQAGKGYSFTLSNVEKKPHIPSILLEPRVAVTPMGSALRFGGTMEICGNDPRISMTRVKGIVDSIRNYYPEVEVDLPQKEDVWYGFRPCSPDGLPYIGRSKEIENLIFNTGHAMMGVSLAPGSGKLISKFIKKESVSHPKLDPNRFN